MVGEQSLPFVLYAVFTTAVLAQGSQGTVKYLLIEMFQEYAFKYWYLMFIFYGKIDESFISRKYTGIGEGAHKEREKTELCSRPLRSRRFEIIKRYFSHRK